MSTAAACWTATILIYLICSVQDMYLCVEVRVPVNYTAMSGDLVISLLDVPVDARLRVELLRMTEQNSHVMVGAVVAMHPPERNTTTSTVTRARFQCGVVTMGGKYRVRVEELPTLDQQVPNTTATTKEVKTSGPAEQDVSSNNRKEDDGRIMRDGGTVDLDVRWPAALLTLTPEHLQTYPEEPVMASLHFPSSICQFAAGSVIPELWLELVYCGPSRAGCSGRNRSHSQVLYKEQERGYPKHRQISLQCQLFGLAGHYALSLRSAIPSLVPLLSQEDSAVYLKAEWSEKFIFNVHARSILPCDVLGGGVAVLFQYPACILEAGDRVRLFARLRADVSALAPPTSLHYVAERRVIRGKHSLYFDCDLFSERYVEYCFVYVNQAITGAVSDVRMDCVPTLPVADSDSGGWGSWSSWTQCSTSCGGGTRNRYRFCDSPPPRYGAKFCQGAALQTERCGGGIDTGYRGSQWECLYPVSHMLNEGGVISERPDVKAEVGPGCRCGCVVHLGAVKPRRLLATSSHSCPGRTFWLIQADPGHVVRLNVDHFRLPCDSQWLKVRDGDSLSSTLVAQLAGSHVTATVVTSTSQFLLLEFFTDELLASGIECGGGFLAHAQQIVPASRNVSMRAPPMLTSLVHPQSFKAVHMAAIVFVSAVLVVSACLVAQYVLRYHKYQRAAAMDECDSVPGSGSNLALTLSHRAASSTTLLSEVISLRRFRPRPAHTRLQEEEEEEEEEEISAAETEPEYEVINTDSKELNELSSTEKSPEECSTVCSNPHKSSTFARAQFELPRAHKHANIRTLSKDKQDLGTTSEEPPSDLESNRSSGSVTGRRLSYARSRTVSGTTITNGCYSPVTSLRESLSRNGSNPKENKDKRNLERLLAGSEFSLTGQDTDLELDYYDYNVSNAGAVPGSYLGMDPAYLVWIPPFAPGCWEEEDDELLQPSERDPYLSQLELRELTGRENPYSLRLVQDLSDREQNNQEIEMEEVTQLLPRGGRRLGCSNKTISNSRVRMDTSGSTSREKLYISDEGGLNENDSGTLKRKRSLGKVDGIRESPVKVHYQYRPGEKETQVEKSPSGPNEYDDIKFADDEEEEEDTDIEMDKKSCDEVIISELNHIKVYD